MSFHNTRAVYLVDLKVLGKVYGSYRHFFLQRIMDSHVHSIQIVKLLIEDFLRGMDPIPLRYGIHT